MTRPPSIIRFEQIYLGVILLGIVNTALGWSQTMARMQSLPPSASAYGPSILMGSLVVGLIIQLLLWYFIARRGSSIAKWVYVVLFAFGVLGILRSIPTGMMPTGLPGVLSIVVLALQAVALWLLFRPDSAEWFARPR